MLLFAGSRTSGLRLSFVASIPPAGRFFVYQILEEHKRNGTERELLVFL